MDEKTKLKELFSAVREKRKKLEEKHFNLIKDTDEINYLVRSKMYSFGKTVLWFNKAESMIDDIIDYLEGAKEIEDIVERIDCGYYD